MDRTSHVFDSAGSALAVTYTATTNASATTGSLATEVYDKLIVYISVSAIVSSGKAALTLECSADGDNWFTQKGMTTSGTSSTTNGVLLDSTGDKMFVFENIGKFSRINVAHTGGTSITVDLCHIEAKS